MQIKRNSVVLVTLNNTQRLALVKSERSTNKINCVKLYNSLKANELQTKKYSTC